MTIFYFTATGNSLAVAKKIGGELVSIAQVVDSDNHCYKDDAIGIVFPIYALGMPKIVKRFLDAAKFETDYLFAIGTYGNMAGAAMHSLQKQALKNGYSFSYTNQILMLDNFLNMFEMEEQLAKLPNKKVDEHMEKIVKDIKERKKFHVPASIGSRTLSSVLGTVMPLKGDYAKKYIVDDNCNICGTCAKVCPTKNIDVTDKVRFHKQCEACMACLHLCPKTALHTKSEKSDKRWRHPDVSLGEIIEANNQL